MAADDPRRLPGGPPGEPVVPLLPGAEPPQDSPFAKLYERRILFLRGPLDDASADELAAAMIALDADGPEAITLLVDSPGGDAACMFTLHDTMTMLRSPVHTRCVGRAATSAAFVLATGTGTRSATPNARIMLHQPAAAIEGTAGDIEDLARELARMRERFERILSERTGKPAGTIRADTRRPRWLSAGEARDYGLVDEVSAARQQTPPGGRRGGWRPPDG